MELRNLFKFTPLNGSYDFSACSGCGDKTLALERHCKCSQTVKGITSWHYGDLDQAAYSTTGLATQRTNQHDCVMLGDEKIEVRLKVIGIL